MGVRVGPCHLGFRESASAIEVCGTHFTRRDRALLRKQDGAVRIDADGAVRIDARCYRLWVTDCGI